MIDTIGIRYKVRLSAKSLFGWNFDYQNLIKRKITKYYRSYYLDNKAVVNYTYFPRSYYKNSDEPVLLQEFSLPHVLYGENLTMITNLQNAFETANIKFADYSELPITDLWKGVIHRLDLCYNHQVGNQVPYFLQALNRLEFPHRQTRLYKDQGVAFYSKHATTKFYDKQKESNLHDAYGILRQESSYRGKPLKRVLGTSLPRVRDLNSGIILDNLESDLRTLHIYDCSIGNLDTTLKSLCTRYGDIAGIYYFGLLNGCANGPSKETLEISLKMHSRTLDRHIAKIIEAGLPLTITESSQPLTPLTIDRALFAVNQINEGLLSQSTK